MDKEREPFGKGPKTLFVQSAGIGVNSFVYRLSDEWSGTALSREDSQDETM
jgi:hypothetical protein